MAASASAFGPETLGHPVPPFTEHAIISSLPEWRDNVDLRKPGDRRVLDALKTVYPRFFVHSAVQKLSRIIEHKLELNGGMCLLYPTKTIADQFQSFVHHRAVLTATPGSVRVIPYSIPEDARSRTGRCTELHIAFFNTELKLIAMEFWQCTGLGISSRLAEHCLSILQGEDGQVETLPEESDQTFGVIVRSEAVVEDQHTSVEKQSSCLDPGAVAKSTLRRRIAMLLETGRMQDNPQEQDVEASSLPATAVGEDDVFLFPTGMSAIWNAHQLCLRARPPAKSVCFGFPFPDTLKVLKKWGPGVHFFGHGHDSDMNGLEKLLAEESHGDPAKPQILALFTEFPSNPLLWSPNLSRLRTLADTYRFLLVIDDTIGNFINVDILPYADIVVTSLTKIFSGRANVMGGSLVLNPKGQCYEVLKSYMSSYEDTYFHEDALIMERNSRDLVPRVLAIDSNTEAILTFLRSRSTAAGAPSAVIKEIYHPKYTRPAHYLKCKRPNGGYGGMFTLTFTSSPAAIAFYDALRCYKGPSLGTTFTLACAFTVLSLPFELEWAAQYGVEEALVRINVGMEDKDILLHSFDAALKAAESVP